MLDDASKDIKLIKQRLEVRRTHVETVSYTHLTLPTKLEV